MVQFVKDVPQKKPICEDEMIRDNITRWHDHLRGLKILMCIQPLP